MKNPALKLQLEKWQEASKPAIPNPAPEIRVPRLWDIRGKVVGGEILWKPIDKAAALLLAKAPWWAHPIHETSKTKTVEPTTNEVRNAKTKTQNAQDVAAKTHQTRNNKGTKTRMKGGITETGVDFGMAQHGPNEEYVSKAGVRIKMVNGEPMFDINDINTMLAQSIASLPIETRPNVKAAQDARKIIDELLNGIGGDMEKFNADSKRYLEDIRQTRFAVVSETAAMTKELKEVRQFFLGSDYKDQISKLKEFVELCERLQTLKESGFLDKVADTMLRLS